MRAFHPLRTIGDTIAPECADLSRAVRGCQLRQLRGLDELQLTTAIHPSQTFLAVSDCGLGGGHIRRRHWTKALSVGNEMEARLC